MSPEEHDDCWYHDDEYHEIHQENDETVRTIQESQTNERELFGHKHSTARLETIDEVNDETENDSCYHDMCLRGLENCLRHQQRRRKAMRKSATEAVLSEQRNQYYCNVYDDEAIARVYLKVTRKCRFRAEVRALRDRREIEDFLLEGLHILETEEENEEMGGDDEGSDRKRRRPTSLKVSRRPRFQVPFAC
jgi:hypothetical protein